MPQFDVAVIGAGSFGSWIAYTLAQRGHRVALADGHGSGNSRASSGGETRIIRFSYGDSGIYSRMARESLGRWKRIFAEAGQNLFVQSGALFTAPAGNSYLEASAGALTRLDIPHERLKSAGLKRRFPQFHFPPGTTGLFEPDSGVILARRAVQCVASAAANLGVTILGTHVSPRTIRKQITAKRYVFACGPWLPSLFPKQLGSLIFPTRQEIVFFGVPRGVEARFQPPHMPAWVDFSAGCYTAPDIENRGFKLGIDIHGPAIDPENDPRVISRPAVERARSMVAKSFPALAGAPIVETRVCCYENTWNGDFLIDRLNDDVWIAGGGSGHGFKHGPAVGHHLADLLEDRIEAEPRFSLESKKTGRSRGVF